MTDLKSVSKNNYSIPESTPTLENIQASCLMRIADASELMARNVLNMQHDLEWYKKRYKESQEREAKLNRSNNALRGHLKRMKKKSNSLPKP